MQDVLHGDLAALEAREQGGGRPGLGFGHRLDFRERQERSDAIQTSPSA
jgi:hypothetical protein